MKDIEIKIKEFIEKILPCEEISFSQEEDVNIYWCQVQSKESHHLLGHHADGLAAINYLVRKLIEKTLSLEESRQLTIIVDVNGQEKKRIENLKGTAHMMAERARFFKNEVEIPPMPAEDRKIIHAFLTKYKDIETESKGLGSSRRVVVRFVTE